MAWLFWLLAAALGLVGIAMLVAGWEMVRRDPRTADTPLPMRVHSIDLNLDGSTPAAAAASAASGSPATDSDARRRALASAIERMSEPARPAPAAAVAAPKGNWEETQPRVNLPAAARTPPA